MSALQRTPLYDVHRALGARLVPFAGFEMPVQYTSILAEHAAVRERAGLFDVSHMGQLHLRGGAAIALWWDDRLLVVQTSYHDMLDLPGGSIDGDEAPLDAAIRELREETGLEAAPAALTAVGTYRYDDMGRRITSYVFAYRPSTPPTPVVDRREIVWAGLLSRAELAKRRISPQLTIYLAAGEAG